MRASDASIFLERGEPHDLKLGTTPLCGVLGSLLYSCFRVAFSRHDDDDDDADDDDDDGE